MHWIIHPNTPPDGLVGDHPGEVGVAGVADALRPVHISWPSLCAWSMYLARRITINACILHVVSRSALVSWPLLLAPRRRRVAPGPCILTVARSISPPAPAGPSRRDWSTYARGRVDRAAAPTSPPSRTGCRCRVPGSPSNPCERESASAHDDGVRSM